MIRGYPEEPTIVQGTTLTLRVATDAPTFRVDFYRQGETLIPLGDLGIGANAGRNTPLHRPDEDWKVDSAVPGWTGYDFAVPDDWPSGAYIAVLVEQDGRGNDTSEPDVTTPDARDGKALFVVRSRRPGSSSSILLKLPLFTYHAYSQEGDPHGCLYIGADVKQATFRRPGGGTGGTPWDSVAQEGGPVTGLPFDVGPFPDVYDPTSPRETYAHWDAPFIAWMDANGLVAEYCTDLDIHDDDGSFLRRYGLLLSVGHDEFWSARMRANVSSFVEAGGNVAFLSANCVWKRVVVQDRAAGLFTFDNYYYRTGDPENALTGVSYRNGGGHWDGPRPAVVGYTVQHADHWFFDGAGVADGDVFGDVYPDDPTEPAALLGFECDGAHVDRTTLASGAPVQPTHLDGTPANFTILGVADLTGFADYGTDEAITGNRVATMGYHVPKGTVFTAATTDWPRVLSTGREPRVEAITRNVLNGLCSLPSMRGLVAHGAFFSPDDDVGHVLAGLDDGTLVDVSFSLQGGMGQEVLANLPAIAAVAGFHSADDDVRHAIVATSDGNVTDVSFAADGSGGRTVLANLPGIVAVSGFHSADDDVRHVVVATSDGNVTDCSSIRGGASAQRVLAVIPGMIGVAAFVSSEDDVRHAVVATRGGDVVECFYRAGTDAGTGLLNNVGAGLTGIAGFYSPANGLHHAIVARRDGVLKEVFYHPRQAVFLR